MNMILVTFLIMFVFTIVWLLEMNRYDNEKTRMMKDKFATPMGFFFIFLASPILVILLYIGNYMADRKRAKR